jgi:small subunit ribosomal protein S21
MKVVIFLPTVTARDNEPFDILLKRFKKKCEKASILSEIKKHQAYEKPSVKKKREENAARRKMLKAQRRMQRFMK